MISKASCEIQSWVLSKTTRQIIDLVRFWHCAYCQTEGVRSKTLLALRRHHWAVGCLLGNVSPLLFLELSTLSIVIKHFLYENKIMFNNSKSMITKSVWFRIKYSCSPYTFFFAAAYPWRDDEAAIHLYARWMPHFPYICSAFLI